MRGLFFNADDAVAREFGDTEALCVVYFLEQNSGAFALLAEGFRRAANALFDDVVTEDYADILAVREVFAKVEGVGDAAFAFLIGVGDVFESEVLAVGEEAEEIAGIFTSCHYHNVADPGVNQGLDGVVNHRLVVDRQQMFIGDFG